MTTDLILGTAGHIDHGKSALVKALTGTDPDRLKEEKARGITIELGFAHAPIASDLVASFVDVPGHERFVRAMLAGVGGIDVVLLVVAADESVMPQTREHFEICRLIGVARGVVAITKSDAVEPGMSELVAVEVAEPLGTVFRQMVKRHLHAAILRSSAGGDGIAQVCGDACSVKRVHQGVGAIGAVVGADDDGGKADDAVIGDPFEQEGAFVAHAGKKGGGHWLALVGCAFIAHLLRRESGAQ